MRVSIAIEASRPSGNVFRLAVSGFVPLPVLWAVAHYAGLI